MAEDCARENEIPGGSSTKYHIKGYQVILAVGSSLNALD